MPTTLGDAISWDNNTPARWTVGKLPEPGDVAQSDAGGYGHVGVVEDVARDSQSRVTSIGVSEYNRAGTGEYSYYTYIADVNGTFWRDTEHTKKWDHFIDLNGIGVGINGQTLSGSNISGRLSLINSLEASYGKDTIASGGWHSLTGNGDAKDISASATHIALINGAGEAYAADISPDNLNNNRPGFVPLYVPEDPNTDGGVKKIMTDKDGNMIAINNCSAAYGWRNITGERQWVKMTSCGDAKDIEIGNGRLALINSCDGAYISDAGYAWTQVLSCGDAKAIAIGETGRIMVINGSNTAYIYNPGTASWVNKTAAGDAQRIAIGKDRILVVTNGGAGWGADVGQNNYASMTKLTVDGDATAITAGAHDRMGVINGAGAAYASDTINQGGSWTPETGNGDAKLFVVG